MKATIKSEQVFTITVDKDIGNPIVIKGCVKEDEWNGLTSFKTPSGEKIIIKMENSLPEVLSRVFGDDTNFKGDVVLCSPFLIP